MRAEPAGYRGDRGSGWLLRGEPARWPVWPGEAEPGGAVIGRHRVTAPRVEYPLGHLRPATRDEHELDLPASVSPFP